MMKYCVVYTVVARIKTLNNKLEAQTKSHFSVVYVGYIQVIMNARLTILVRFQFKNNLYNLDVLNEVKDLLRSGR